MNSLFKWLSLTSLSPCRNLFRTESRGPCRGEGAAETGSEQARNFESQTTSPSPLDNSRPSRREGEAWQLPLANNRFLLVLLLCLTTTFCFAQRWGRRGRGNRVGNLDQYREYNDIPKWENPKGFEHDTFTFARVRYDSHWGGGGWAVDYPDSDLNFSLRLQQLTSIKVNPNPVIVKLSDENLGDYPFLYMIEPGGIELYEKEVEGLRKYCLNGGFMMVDDFWGDREYDVFHDQIKRVFPDRPVEELPISHEIFHNVYNLEEKPQIPSIGWAYDGNTWEVRKGPSARDVHYRAIKDDDGRIMVLICHNTDLGDGWEREGENREYFEKFSVKKAYPMGINIITYAMTH